RRRQLITDHRPLTTDRGAIVIGGNFMALGIARSLGRQGIPVWVLHDDHLIATASRYTQRSLPWRQAEESRQIEFLLDIGARCRLQGWTLFPATDTAAGLISRYHPVLAEHYALITPSWDVMKYAYDKRLTHRLAAEAGVDCPTTYYPQ